MTAALVDSLRRIAIELAHDAGQRALAGRESARGTPLNTTTKSSVTDLVTEHDQAAEDFIRQRLVQMRPDDGVIGEEGTSLGSRSGVTWIIDPIDGTTNFVYGGVAWGPSVAAALDGEVIAGAVHIPATGETFHAGRGYGAAVNDHPIEVNPVTTLAQALVATGFGYDSMLRAKQGSRIAQLLPEIRDIRRSGSAAYDLCSVACGRVDAYVEDHLNSWDVAAGLLIATEAGAITSAIDGGPVTPASVLVAAPGIHADLVEKLQALKP